ncbi:MAG: hypothetical protein ACREUZ_07755 [Burkholderiales bacterium]
MEDLSKSVAPRRGRPRKFTGPSRAVTLTLPLKVIDALNAIDADLSRAVVRLAQPELARRPHPPAELAKFGRRAVIVINPTRTLERRTGVELVPLPDGRALIAFERQTTPEALELLISDALEDPQLPAMDRAVFNGIVAILRSARRASDVSLRQSNIIVLEGGRRHQPRSVTAPRRTRSRRPKSV